MQTVHTQKARLVFFQAEPNFWLHMSIELGISRYQIRDANGKLRTVTDYLDAELNDDAVEGILHAGYQIYKVCLTSNPQLYIYYRWLIYICS